TNQVLASGNSSNPNRGFSATVRFTPATTDAVRIQVTITPPTGGADTLDLDYAPLPAAHDYGILSPPTSSGGLPPPAQLSSLAQSEYSRASNFTVSNGSIVQGQAHGYASSPVWADTTNGLSINGVHTQDYGMDTLNVDGTWGTGSIVIRNSVFQDTIDNI